MSFRGLFLVKNWLLIYLLFILFGIIIYFIFLYIFVYYFYNVILVFANKKLNNESIKYFF